MRKRITEKTGIWENVRLIVSDWCLQLAVEVHPENGKGSLIEAVLDHYTRTDPLTMHRALNRRDK